jgi:hypothetical protein
MAKVPDSWRRAGRHEYPAWRVGMPHNKKQDDYYEQAWEKQDQTQRYGDSRVLAQAYASAEES